MVIFLLLFNDSVKWSNAPCGIPIVNIPTIRTRKLISDKLNISLFGLLLSINRYKIIKKGKIKLLNLQKSSIRQPLQTNLFVILKT